MAGGLGTAGLGMVGCVGAGGLGIVGIAGLGMGGFAVPGLGTEGLLGLLGVPGCMMDPGTCAAAVAAKQRPASARVIAGCQVMVCSSPELSGRSPEREKGHRPCQTPLSENDDNRS